MSRRGLAMLWSALANATRERTCLGGAPAAAAALLALRTAPATTASALDATASGATPNPPALWHQITSSSSRRQPAAAPASACSLPPPSQTSIGHRITISGPCRTRNGPAATSIATWRSPSRGFSASAAALSPAPGAEDGGGSAPPGGGGGGGAGVSGPAAGGETRLSLGEALNQLVDAAVEKVEAGQLDEAVSLLKDGLSTFEPVFPNSPELGELHNQAALLLLFQGRPQEAADHAQASLETTRRHFGARSLLTAHRLLRLGICRFALGNMADAAGLLREALELLDAAGGGAAAAAADPGSRCEAGFYLDCVALAHVKDAGGVETLSGSLRANVRGMKEAYGAESMILSLALHQHSRLVNGGLEQGAEVAVGEALLRQQIALLSEVHGPDSEEVAVARYKLGTYYYSQDLLQDAGLTVRQAAVALRALHSEEHDLVVLCKHRMGMICAAQGDHRSAVQLLQASRNHFSEEGSQSMLAKEADIGLAMAKFRAVDTARDSAAKRAELQQDALELLRTEIEALAQAVGTGHMLVQGATRYYGQLAKMAR
ncbi:hypothetical protein PLESTM_001504200 [Pleodorina starrii]|nr:hypothetical protein PLESTM_001504200 [Pleodorina starrii]